ncbi:PAX3- and PAX7-binding protein 1 [Armadillidium vulgare]|nr:PAX3- and PAX7-binding protein 1 [Armadillidium vulgare]
MSLFKKRKNVHIRQRRIGIDDDDDTVESPSEKSIPLNENSNDLNKVTTPQVKPQILGSNETYFGKKEKKKSKPKTEKKTNILSFEDELEADDGIVFQEKKSSLSYKLRKEMKKERKEKKREERDKLRQIGEKDKKDRTMTVSDLDDLGIRIVNGREAEAIAAVPGDSDESDEDSGKPVYRPGSKSGDSSLQPWKAALQSGHIPDANLIHQIRKERQKARERGDFLPLDDTGKVEESKGRLIRDDDNDRSDEEGESRIKFSVNQDEIDRKQRREVFEAAQAVEDSDHDAEWEMQQLRKAGATAAKISLENESKQDNSFDHSTQSSHGIGGVLAHSSLASETVPSWGVTEITSSLSSTSLEKPVNYQAEGIIKRLRDSRESLNEVHRRHKAEADNIIDELIASKSLISRCNEEQRPLTESFKFYQDMRGYVTDLRECLNEKVAEIKKLEEQVYLIYRQKSQKLVQRRRQDVKDQIMNFPHLQAKWQKETNTECGEQLKEKVGGQGDDVKERGKGRLVIMMECLLTTKKQHHRHKLCSLN